MSRDTVGEQISLIYDPDEDGWMVSSRPGLHPLVVYSDNALGGLAQCLASGVSDDINLKGLPQAARLQRAAKLCTEAAAALTQAAENILDTAENTGVTEEGGYELDLREGIRCTRKLDVRAFAAAHPRDFMDLATVPLGRIDHLFGRVEVDHYCTSTEKVVRTRKLVTIGEVE